MESCINDANEEANIPLLESLGGQRHQQVLAERVWTESKKLWRIVGPAVFSRIATFSMFIISQAFAGHLGDLELAAISIASNVILGFNLGLLVWCIPLLLSQPLVLSSD